MQNGVQGYEGFLSALAGVTGTLVALLFGFAGAYYVFLKERTSQFDDQIAQQKLEIRDTLSRLRAAWPLPPTLSAHLPPDFENYVRAKYPNGSEADLLGRLLADTEFENPPIPEIVAERLSDKLYGGPWKGRVYFWLLGKTVEVLTLRPPALDSFPRTVSDTIPKGVFPSEATGPGFENWHATHATVREWARFFLRNRQMFEDDYFLFTSGRNGGIRAKDLNETFNTSLAAFYDGLNEVNKEVDAVDRANLLRGRYSTERLHPWSLLILVSLSAIVGILVPLGLLALPGVRLTTSVAIALLLGAVVFLGAAYLQLARDVATESTDDINEYFRARWYLPLLAGLDNQATQLGRVGMIDSGPFESALRSRDAERFSTGLLKALHAVVDQANLLNRSADALVACVVPDLLNDRETRGLVKPPGSEGGSTLSPLDLADPARFEEWRAGYERAPLMGIAFEAQGPSWSSPKGAIPKPTTDAEKQRVVAVLERFHNRAVLLDEAATFRAARTSVSESLARLRDELEAAVRSGRR